MGRCKEQSSARSAAVELESRVAPIGQAENHASRASPFAKKTSGDVEASLQSRQTRPSLVSSAFLSSRRENS